MKRVAESCAFCQGKGTDPYGIPSWKSGCAVCGGGGALKIPQENVACAHCRGTGSIKRFICTVCHGSGVVSRHLGATCACPTCGSDGHDPQNPTLDCLHCRGKGWLPIKTNPDQPTSNLSP